MAEAALWWAALCGLYTVLISTVDAPALLLAGCLAVGLVPTVGRPIAAAAARFTDRSGYLGAVLDRAAAPPLPAPPADRTGSSILLGLLGDYVTWLLVGLAGLLAAVAALS
ncbi:hypothetical protein [Kitasatospora cineracea]|uniref:Uncharacterized protein n=1 Tax=Kitasatospora cineracea TaxID=88074 RepID=A0A3N4RT33_9ACTN|nr:hypothetical protein [Kitasatospora cineracea]RPE36533.1 hypothetical protein EDD38_4908 [Kitasatospora cineracea]